MTNAKHIHTLDAAQVELIRESLHRFDAFGAAETVRQELLVLTECSEIALRLDHEENNLLAALEYLLPIAEKNVETSFGKDAVRIARAAIAKAKGE